MTEDQRIIKETRTELYREGKTDAEIAKIQGVSESTVKSWRNRQGFINNEGKPRSARAKDKELVRAKPLLIVDIASGEVKYGSDLFDDYRNTRRLAE